MMRPPVLYYETSAAWIRERLAEAGLPLPSLAVILGSGLGSYAESDRISEKIVFSYREIPDFPHSTVSYQAGTLTAGMCGGRCVLFFNGRFHYYEGWELWQASYPAAVCHLLGVPAMIITNAAGGISADRLCAGDLVCVTDHIKLCADSPLRGENDEIFGPRFFDMQSVYDQDLIRLAEDRAEALGFSLKEGVYAYMTGPQFETPAEIRMLRALGADLVGMSTVPEVIEAAHCGMQVLCISCVTNLAAGVTGAPMTEEEVLETASKTSARFTALMDALLVSI